MSLNPKDKRQYPADLSIDSDMLDAEYSSHGDQGDDKDPHSSNEEDEDSLLRMSDQARRRTRRRNDDDFYFESGQGEDDDDDDVDEDEEDEEDDEEEEEDEEEGEGEEDDDIFDEADAFHDIHPSDFLGRLIQARSRRNNRDNDINIDLEDEEDEEDEEEDLGNGQEDSRAEFFRAIGSLSNGRNGGAGAERGGANTEGTGGNGAAREQTFVDVIQRLMGEGFSSGFNQNNSEMDGLINNLTQKDDSYIVLETLNELSERLLMMNGITAERVIPSNRLAKALIDIMNDPNLAEELELQLVACRCLYNFLEVNLDFIHDAINNNAIETLCRKLSEISFIDLTEQALQTLQMISRDPISHGQIISNDGLTVCLQYLDFLTIHSQRKCLSIVANSCTNISVHNFDRIDGVFENISNVAKQHSDPNVIENAWLSISRIITSFRSYPNYLEKLFLSRTDLLNELVQTVIRSSNKSSLSSSTDVNKLPVNFGSCISLIKSLIILVSASVDISGILLMDINIGENIIKSINKYSRNNSSTSSSTSNLEVIKSKSSNDNVLIEGIMAAPNELLSQFLTLIGYLLPISYNSQETPFLKNSHEETEEKVSINERRNDLCRSVMPDAYWKFINEIWSFLINSFQATMDFEVRRKGLINLFRIIKFMNPEDVDKIKGIEIVSGLLASIVNQNKSVILKDLGSEAKVTSSQNDTEMKTSDDEDEDDDEVDVGDYVLNSQEKKTPTDSMAKMNSNTLMLSSLLIMLNLIKTSPQIFIETFEKEGLINDVLLIAETLKAAGLNDQIEDDYERTRPFSATYNNKYIDSEFTKEYEYKLTSNRIYNKLFHLSNDIEEFYTEIKKSNGSTDSSLFYNMLNEVKSRLEDESSTISMGFEDWKQLWKQLKNTLDGVSSFELISSGIIQTLTKVFSSPTLGASNSVCYNSFMVVFYNSNDSSSILTFIDKLQEALTRAESFEIISAGSNNSEVSRLASIYYDNSQTAGMAKQIKLRLVPENPDQIKLPSTMQNMVLSVHAIATFTSIDTFLNQRLNFLQQLTGGTRGIEEDSDPEELNDSRDVDDEINAAENDSDEDMEVGNKPKGEKLTSSSSHIEFLINGEVIPNQTTIYGAIYRTLQSEPDEIVDSGRIWSTIHQISFRKVPESETANEFGDGSHNGLLYSSNINYSELESYDKTSVNILKLLKILFEMNLFANTLGYGKVSDDKFMNWKLSVKLNRQLEEPLIVASGTLPGWAIHVTRQFPFIFPLNTRIFFLQSTSFGYSRLIHQWQIRTNQENENNGTNRSLQGQRPQLGRPLRHKVRVSRKLILQSAIKVLNLYGTTPGVLEIEYFDEVGSGLGPTLEFYSTVSKEFSKKKLRLWRDDDNTGNEEGFINYQTGLFPRPMDKKQTQSENGKKQLYLFSMLGKFIARALLDSRIIDFKFNSLFLRLVQIFNDHSLNSSGVNDLKKIANINSLRMVDSYLADSMEHLMKYVEAYKGIPLDQRESITVDSCTLEDLSLSFTLPGYPSYELIPNGDNISINSTNIESYISKVIEATLYTGIISQTKAFMDGFSKVFPINSLVVFSAEELVNLFGNAEEDWSYDTLYGAINANHGYTKDSDAIRTLVNILVEFNDIEKRSFLQFLTGAPKLPIGGFKNLNPELTVVRKYPEGDLKDDDYLPSVMTCANYLKLPNYSTEETMKERLVQAINEGAGAFLLS